jgi:uncharacterized membrane protein YphA (DoxX/SURF4 family)
MSAVRSAIGTRTRATWSTAMRVALPLTSSTVPRAATGQPDRDIASRAGGVTRASAIATSRHAVALVPLRIFVGVIWLRAAAEKISEPAWWTGSGVEAFVRTQLASGAVATDWCAWLAENVVLTHAQTVAWVVVVLQTLAGLAILLGVASALFLIVGIAMNVSFLLMGAVNPSAFYIAMQATLLFGDAGSVVGVERIFATDHTRRLRRWHEAMACDTRMWKVVSGGLAAITALAAIQIDRLTPAELVADPMAALALLAGTATVAALFQAAGCGPDHRLYGRAERTAATSARSTVGAPPPSQPLQPHGPTSDGLRTGEEPQAKPTPDPRSIGVRSNRLSRRRVDRGLRLSPPPCGRAHSRPTTTSGATTPATAVRTYLAFLRDPSVLSDVDGVAELQRTVDQTDRAGQLRERVLDVQRRAMTAHEEAFVEHAKTWADVNGVSGEAFAAEGVPVAVLRRAGFGDVTATPRPQQRSGSGQKHGRRPPGAAARVRAVIPAGTFTAKRLQELSGASATTVRRVIREGVEAGDLVERGVDADHSGQGRAPIVYEAV